MDPQMNQALSNLRQQLLIVKDTKDSFIQEQPGYIPMAVLHDLQKLELVIDHLNFINSK